MNFSAVVAKQINRIYCENLIVKDLDSWKSQIPAKAHINMSTSHVLWTGNHCSKCLDPF